MSDKPTSSSENSDEVARKFPGLTRKKPAKSISVERPVDSEEKTVTETGIHSVEDADATRRTAPNATGRDVSSKPARKPSQRITKNHDRMPPEHGPSDDVDAADNADDTVLELPPSPGQRRAKRRRNTLIGLGVTTVLVIGGWALLFFSPILAIEEIQHEGLDLVTESEAAERTAGLEGKPLPQVGERGVTELFEDTPAVDDVSLRAEPPHGLVVEVHEHRPIAMSPRDKQYVVFSEDGTELAEITSKKAQEFDLPVVVSAADVTDEDVFNTITEVLGSLPEDLRDHVRAASGSSIDSIELELTSGKTVMWGNNEEAEKKAKVLQALLGLEDEAAEGISEYDVSAPDFPVTR